MDRPAGIRLELEQRIIKNKFEELKETEVGGNAFLDHDILNFAPRLAIEALSANLPDLGFEIFDWLGQKVMGLEPMSWDHSDGSRELDGFVGTLTWYHRDGLVWQ